MISRLLLSRERRGKKIHTHTPRLTINFSQIELLDVFPNCICSFFHHWIVNNVSGRWCAIKLRLTFWENFLLLICTVILRLRKWIATLSLHLNAYHEATIEDELQGHDLTFKLLQCVIKLTASHQNWLDRACYARQSIFIRLLKGKADDDAAENLSLQDGIETPHLK